jgi:hypothetical protein
MILEVEPFAKPLLIRVVEISKQISFFNTFSTSATLVHLADYRKTVTSHFEEPLRLKSERRQIELVRAASLNFNLLFLCQTLVTYFWLVAAREALSISANKKKKSHFQVVSGFC